MHPTIDSVLGKVERQRERLEAAQEAAEEALTVFFEQHLAELAKRFPKRRFHASSGNGSLSIDIAPGPYKDREYSWIWGTMIGSDSYWGFIWKEWEELLDAFSERSGLEYVNFNRDITVTGEAYKG
jgi:hypothetical protein